MAGGRARTARFPSTTLFRSVDVRRGPGRADAAEHRAEEIGYEARRVGRQLVEVGDRHFPGLELFGLEAPRDVRSEEHTSELQSRGHLVCRLLLEKKKTSYVA